jgi:hypothetical protein
VGSNFFDLKTLSWASILITLGTSWIVLGLQCALVWTFLSLRLLANTYTTQVDFIQVPKLNFFFSYLIKSGLLLVVWA